MTDDQYRLCEQVEIWDDVGWELTRLTVRMLEASAECHRRLWTEAFPVVEPDEYVLTRIARRARPLGEFYE